MPAQLNLGLINPKSPSNMGSILRAAGCYGVDAIHYTGRRYDTAKRFATDTKNYRSQVPCRHTDSLQQVIPTAATVVTVELIEGATPLPHFVHPNNAFYIFGPEDGSVKSDVLQYSDEVVYVPTKGCMNLAATVNVLLYDRLAKSSTTQWGDELIKASRDKNNRAKWQGRD